MAEATQFSFTWAEVAELLIKKQDIHEGTWMAALELTVNAGMLGISQAESRPGAMFLVNGVNLTKALPEAAPYMVVDAAKVNPAK